MGLDKFSTALDLLKGFNVNLYVGEEVIKGKLIGVEADHVVVENDKNYIFYYSIDKIQAITKNTKQFQVEEIATTFQKTQSLAELLQSFKNSWVSILTLNKQRFSGVLSEIDSDFVTLINGEERILIKLTHISNILKGFIKEEEKKPEPKKEEEKNKNEAKNDDNQSKENSETNKKNTQNNSDKKSKSSAKDSNNSSEKKSTSETQPEKTMSVQEDVVNAQAIIEEPVQTNIWSQPIKIEAEKIEEVTNNQQNLASDISTEVPAPKIHTTSKKQNNEVSQNNNNSEEQKKMEEKAVASLKEIKQVKEESVKEAIAPKENNELKVEIKKESNVTKANKEVKVESKKESNTTKANKEVKAESKKESNVPKENKEVKSTKPLEPLTFVNSVKDNSQNQSLKKSSNSKNDMEQKNKQESNQKEQDKSLFRFAGEPVSRENQRAFPFAGWPNRQKNRATFKSFDNFF